MRREHRQLSRRAWQRSAGAKAKQFFELHSRGVSKDAMASILGLTTEGVDELYAALEQEHQGDAVEAGGGGG